MGGPVLTSLLFVALVLLGFTALGGRARQVCTALAAVLVVAAFVISLVEL